MLHDGAVTLRPHTRDDLDAVYERSLDPLTARWTTIPQPYQRQHAVEYLDLLLLDPGLLLSWAIDVDGAMAGSIDVTLTDESGAQGELGYAGTSRCPIC